MLGATSRWAGTWKLGLNNGRSASDPKSTPPTHNGALWLWAIQWWIGGIVPARSGKACGSCSVCMSCIPFLILYRTRKYKSSAQSSEKGDPTRVSVAHPVHRSPPAKAFDSAHACTCPLSSTTACICSSTVVIVLDQRQAGTWRSYSSSISAADRLWRVSRVALDDTRHPRMQGEAALTLSSLEHTAT